MATKNNPGAYDCYANAAPDEPMFVLLGRDKHAPLLTRIWALLRHRDGEAAAKVAEALSCADAMDAWARGIGKPPLEGAIVEDILEAATDEMHAHPEGFDHPCWCNLCMTYADGP